MATINLRSRQLTAQGAGLNALTVEIYAVDVNGLPTGAAVASSSTDINGVWKILAAANLQHGTRYCVKIINGSEIQWIDGSDQGLFDELAVATRLVLPDGQVVDATHKAGEVEAIAAASVGDAGCTTTDITIPSASKLLWVAVNGLVRDGATLTNPTTVHYGYTAVAGDRVVVHYVAS